MKVWNCNIFNVVRILLCISVVTSTWATPLPKFPDNPEKLQFQISSNNWKQNSSIPTKNGSYKSTLLANSNDNKTNVTMEHPNYFSKPISNLMQPIANFKVDKTDKVLIQNLGINHYFKMRKHKENKRYFRPTQEDFHIMENILNSNNANYNNIRSKRDTKILSRRKNPRSYLSNDLKDSKRSKNAIFLDLENNQKAFTKTKLKTDSLEYMTMTSESLEVDTTTEKFLDNYDENDAESSMMEQEGTLTTSEVSMNLSDEIEIKALTTNSETLTSRSDEAEIESTSEASISASDETDMKVLSTTSEISISASDEVGKESTSTIFESSMSSTEDQEFETTSTNLNSRDVSVEDADDAEVDISSSTIEPYEINTDSDIVEDNTSSSSNPVDSIRLKPPTQIFIDLVDSPYLSSETEYQLSVASTPNSPILNQLESDAKDLNDIAEHSTPTLSSSLRPVTITATVPSSTVGNSTNRAVSALEYMDLPIAKSINLPISTESSMALESTNLSNNQILQGSRNASTSSVEHDLHEGMPTEKFVTGSQQWLITSTASSSDNFQELIRSTLNSKYSVETKISSTVSSYAGPISISITRKNIISSTTARSSMVLSGNYSHEDATLSSKPVQPTSNEGQKVKVEGRRMPGPKPTPSLASYFENIFSRMEMPKITSTENQQDPGLLFKPFYRGPQDIQQMGRSLTRDEY